MIDIYPQIYQELDTHIADYLKSEKCANVLKMKKVKVIFGTLLIVLLTGALGYFI